MNAIQSSSLSEIVYGIQKEKKAERIARTSSETRKAAWKEAVASLDLEALSEVEGKMESFVSKIAVIEKKSEVGLTETEAASLMSEFVALKDIEEFLSARRSMIRSLVFEALNDELLSEGVEDPENTNGAIEVPELQKKFCREGAGYKEPKLDEKKLKKELGEDWSRVVVETIIPEQKVYEVDETLLFQLMQEKPEVLEKLRNSTIAGEVKSPRFTVRDMK